MCRQCDTLFPLNNSGHSNLYKSRITLNTVQPAHSISQYNTFLSIFFLFPCMRFLSTIGCNNNSNNQPCESDSNRMMSYSC
mmetsp:Transcript_100563/g.197416  ORF Transcript_100563/g.197416 Transcript_100563/m.197416 type:complete len:81 (-) Transcript_100563:1131-1373(-)